MRKKLTPSSQAPIQLALSPKQAADALSISERKLWSLTNSGEIPARRCGNRVLYSVVALQNWIDEQSDQFDPTSNKWRRGTKAA